MKKILFVILTCLVACQPKNDNSSTVSAIKPPLPHLNLQHTKYQINPNRDTILYYKTGSKLYIPKNAFTHTNGDLVTSTVSLQYREFHSSLDIFLSGIPMQYDSTGSKYHFESAGMCEFYGFEGATPLKIAKDKTCKIEMASQKVSTKFNLYQLDTTSGTWTYLGKDIVAPIRTKQKVKKKEVAPSLDFPKITKPAKPIEANPDRPWVQLDIIDEECPELIGYKNVIFEVLETKPYSPENQQIVWDKVSLKKGKKQGTYIICFEKGDKKGEYDVQPVLQGEDYQAALKEYEKKFAAYEATKKQIEQNKEKARQNSEAMVKQAEDEMQQAIAATKLQQENDAKQLAEQERKAMTAAKLQQENDAKQLAEQERQVIVDAKLQQEISAKQLAEQEKEEMLRLQNANLLESNRAVMMRTISINNFGVYNCDYPQRLPKERHIAANFMEENNNVIFTDKIVLLEKKPNTSYYYYSDYLPRFQFNPNQNNVAFCITHEGYLAYFTSADFKKIPENVKQYNFHMRIHKEKLKSHEELTALLGIK